MDRRQAIIGIILTFAAWGCFSLMDTVPDYSTTQNILNFAGYILCALALWALYGAMRSPKS